MNVALFDFCETLVDKQTADDFIKFILKKHHKYVRLFAFNFLKNKFLIKVLFRIGFKPNFKSVFVYLIKGITFKEIDSCAVEYSRQLCSENIIMPVYERLIALKNSGTCIWIVSGGYQAYIKYFFPEIIERVVSNQFEFDSDMRATGKLMGVDCMGNEKVRRINMEHNAIDYDFVISFSDSESDLPMMSMAKKAVVVSKKYSQQWAQSYDYEEIVWGEK